MPCVDDSGAAVVMTDTSKLYAVEAQLYTHANAAVGDPVVKTFKIGQSNIDFGTPAANYLQEGGTDGNVKIDLTKLDSISGSQPGVEDTYKPGTTHGYKIEIFNSSGEALVIKDALTATNGDKFFLKADGAGSNSHDDMLKTALAADETLTVRLTAVDSAGAAIAYNTFDQTIAIDKD